MTQVFTKITSLPEGYVSQGIISGIGRTPVIPITNLVNQNSDVRILAKAEFMNPGGSVKDRAAWNIIKEGILNGHLTYEKTILDATSGNTGIAYAMIAASLGFQVKLFIPKNVSPERIRLLKAYNAKIEFTDPLEGTDGAILKAKELYLQSPEEYFHADQYNNPANWLTHYNTTANEILNQTAGEITHFVAGLGTSGTFMGTTKRLKEENPAIESVSVQPDSPFHGIEGLKHMETAVVPGIFDSNLIDVDLRVSTTEAQKQVKNLAAKEGILVGLSSGAAMAASLKVASEIDNGLIVCIFPDRGERYLSEKFWCV